MKRRSSGSLSKILRQSTSLAHVQFVPHSTCHSIVRSRSAPHNSSRYFYKECLRCTQVRLRPPIVKIPTLFIWWRTAWRSRLRQANNKWSNFKGISAWLVAPRTAFARRISIRFTSLLTSSSSGCRYSTPPCRNSPDRCLRRQRSATSFESADVRPTGFTATKKEQAKESDWWPLKARKRCPHTWLVKVKPYGFWMNNLHPSGSIFNPKTLTNHPPTAKSAYEVSNPKICLQERHTRKKRTRKTCSNYSKIWTYNFLFLIEF